MSTLPLLTLTIASGLLIHTAKAKSNRVYFGTSESKGIYFSDLDLDSGELTDPRLAIEIGLPGFLAIHPNGKYIYSVAADPDTGDRAAVAAMKIKPDGTLELINIQKTEGRGTCHVNIDKTGQCLMAAYYSSGGVASFSIRKDGSLSEARSYFQHKGSGANPKRQKAPHAHSIFSNPANSHAYVPDLGIDKVMIYELDPKAGSLTTASFAEVPGGGMGPRHMKWSENGEFAYVLNELDLSISVFRRGKESGSLEFIETGSILPDGTSGEDMTAAEIRIHPNGRFIYASSRDLTEKGRDSISVFTRFEDGFRRLATSPAQVWVPRNFNIDPTGRWLIAGGQKSHDLVIFSVDPQSGLLEFTGTRIPFNGGPICIEFLDK